MMLSFCVSPIVFREVAATKKRNEVEPPYKIKTTQGGERAQCGACWMLSISYAPMLQQKTGSLPCDIKAK